MKDQDYFSTKEVCEYFNLPRSSLFRWEKEGQLDLIPRDAGDVESEKASNIKRRKYFNEQLDTISQLVSRRKIKKIYNGVNNKDETTAISELIRAQQDNTVHKVISKNETGLMELYELRNSGGRLSSSNIIRLLKYAIRSYDPFEEEFISIIETINETLKRVRDSN